MARYLTGTRLPHADAAAVEGGEAHLPASANSEDPTQSAFISTWCGVDGSVQLKLSVF